MQAVKQAGEAAKRRESTRARGGRSTWTFSDTPPRQLARSPRPGLTPRTLETYATPNHQAVPRRAASRQPAAAAAAAPPAAAPRRRRRPAAPAAPALGDQVVGGFLDLAKLVSGTQGTRSPYDDLAASIGRDVYADLGGWHILLRDLSVQPGADAKMSAALAAELGPRAADRLAERDVEAVLARVPVRLGGGRTTVPLLELVPSAGVRDLTRLVEEFGRKR
jgi:hypothetical protein